MLAESHGRCRYSSRQRQARTCAFPVLEDGCLQPSGPTQHNFWWGREPTLNSVPLVMVTVPCWVAWPGSSPNVLYSKTLR